MRTYTDEEIRGLITCVKRTTQPPRKDLRPEGGQLRNDMHVESEDGRERFSIFMRVNDTFRENYSIGLMYWPQEGQSFQIFRCNGPHGEHREIERDPDSSHYHYHVHEASAEDLNEGILAPKRAKSTSGYASYEQALVFFLEQINLRDSDDYFSPKLLQLPFEAENQ